MMDHDEASFDQVGLECGSGCLGKLPYFNAEGALDMQFHPCAFFLHVAFLHCTFLFTWPVYFVARYLR